MFNFFKKNTGNDQPDAKSIRDSVLRMIKEELQHKTELDKWLTERYCLYFEKKDKAYRYDIHHKEWELKRVEIKQLRLNYKIGKIQLGDKKPEHTHYSNGVKVISWGRQKLSDE